jgi:hypothetical protein
MAPFTPEVLPANYRAEFDQLSEAGRQAWLEQRLRGQIDHLFLGNELMGYDFQPNPHAALFREFLQKDREQQRPLYQLGSPCKCILRTGTPDAQCKKCNGTGWNRRKKRMIHWPRGLFKTSAVIVEIVQLILNYPNIRILFLTGNLRLGRRQLARVKKVFEQPSAKFRQLYPEFCAIPGKKLPDSSGEEFTVPCRTMRQFAEPTFSISSAKSVKAGSHYDVIFVDDLVNDQNYKSAKALEDAWDDYCSVGPLLEPAGFLFITGTPYAFGDTYERIEEAAKKEEAETGGTVWEFSFKSCWIKFCKTCGHPDLRHDSDRNYTHPPCTMEGCECKCFVDSGQKQVLFPLAITRDGRQVGHTVEFLESERREKGADFFALQYECRRIAQEEQRYTPELLARQTFYHLSMMPAQAGTFMVGDLSYIGDDKRDLSVLYLVKVWMGVLWVYHCIAGNWDSDQACNAILLAIIQHRPQAVWLEKFLGWEAYNNILMSKAAALQLQQLPVDWKKLDRRPAAKTLRIGTPLSWLIDKKLWLYAGMPYFDKLTNQLLKWPKIPHHDDFGDCLGHACEAPHGAAGTPAPPPGGTMMDRVRKMHRDREERIGMDGFGGGGTGSGIVSG